MGQESAFNGVKIFEVRNYFVSFAFERSTLNDNQNNGKITIIKHNYMAIMLQI